MVEEFIKWIGRSVPEAACFLLFVQVFLNIPISKKEVLIHSLIIGAITLFTPSIFPTQQGPVIVVSTAVYLNVFLVKKKSTLTVETVLPIIYCLALLILSDMVSFAILLNVLGISQELIMSGDAITRVLSTVGLILVYLPVTYITYNYNKRKSKNLNESKKTILGE